MDLPHIGEGYMMVCAGLASHGTNVNLHAGQGVILYGLVSLACPSPVGTSIAICCTSSREGNGAMSEAGINVDEGESRKEGDDIG